MTTFDAKTTLAQLEEEAAVKRKSRFRKSKLDRFGFEILQLRKEGASYGLILSWLKKQRVGIHSTSTIKRWVDSHS